MVQLGQGGVYQRNDKNEIHSKDILVKFSSQTTLHGVKYLSAASSWIRK